MAIPFRHFRHFPQPAPPRPLARARLALEQLEDRAVPATIFTVNTLADENTPNDGFLSLREAIGDASIGDNIITFSPGLTGTITLTLGALPDINTNVALAVQGPGANLVAVNLNSTTLHINSVFVGANVSLSGLTFRSGGNGGNIQLAPTNRAAVTLSGVEVTGSSAIGVESHGGTLTILNSTIAGNVDAGLTTATGAGDLVIDQSTIADNGDGGVDAATSGAVVTIRNSTVANNTGDGIFMINGANVTLASTLVAGNTGRDVLGALQPASDHNLIGKDTGLAGITNGFNFNLVGTAAAPINPLLGPLQLNGGPTRTRALLPGSPAIDHGFNPAGLTFDQRGSPFLRAFGGGVDIGAFELIVQAAQPPGGQAVQAAVTLLNSFKSAGVRLAAFAFGELNGDFVNDLILAVRLRNNKLVMLTFDGRDGHIVGVFVPFSTPASASARVQLVLVNLNSDPALEIGLIVTPSGGGVPHISAFSGTGTRIL
jgi:CSLREA domain-containing protein